MEMRWNAEKECAGGNEDGREPALGKPAGRAKKTFVIVFAGLLSFARAIGLSQTLFAFPPTPTITLDKTRKNI